MTRKNQSGQAIVTAALAMVVLLGASGLAVDMGVLRYKKRIQQTAADSAAVAGADDIRYNAGAGVTGAAKDASATNGFTDGVNNVTVTVNRGPAAGPHLGNTNYVEVLVSAVHPTYFVKIFGVNNSTVTARAVATLIGESGTSPGCLFTLGPPGTGVGVTTGGNPRVHAPTCGIEDNGNFTTNGQRVDIEAGSIGVVGSDRNNGGGTVTCSGSATNCPVTGIPPTGDPLSFVPPPCNPCTGGSPLNVSTTQTISPGTYSSISITGGTVDFLPGTYIITGNFTVNGNTTICNSTNTNCSGMPGSANAGVTFYITNGGSLTINGTSTSQLSAPTSGTYAGMLFYQDPHDTSVAKLDGTGASFFQGGLYFPKAEVDFGGTSFTNATAAYTIIVANDLKFNGNSDVFINSDYSALPGGVSIIENAALVE
jgi:Flp pilus assembly protein TadG